MRKRDQAAALQSGARHHHERRRARTGRRPALTGFVATVVAALALALAPTVAEADVGFIDGSFGGASAPTAQKPQSKLWIADGIWWASMFNSFTQRFEIHQRDPATERWMTTGTVIDGRRNTFSDAKWDGSHLFIVSAGPSQTSTLDEVRLQRFSYTSSTKSWSPDPGFPVTISPTGTEAAVLDKDTTGRIWITYTQGQKVWVTHSTTGTATYTAPFVLPVDGAANLTADDITTVVAFDGNIGVMWSNQNDWAIYFAVHADGDPDSAWTPKPAIQRSEWADDHLNVKALQADPSGNKVFAATKTSLNGAGDPLLLLNVFNGTTWTSYTYGTVMDHVTRPLVMIDSQHRQLYVFATAPCCSGGVAYYKQTSLDRISFPPGLGTPFMESAAHPSINNVSSTKQTVDAVTDLVALAGDDGTHTYVHNTLDLDAADVTPPDTTIDSGPTGTVNNPDARFTFSAFESNPTFECSLDGSAFASCTSPTVYADLADGSHTFRVRAIDAAGNLDPTPASRSWTIEDTATVVQFTAQADAYVDQARPSVNSGSGATLRTDKSETGTADKQSYMRFTVSGVRKVVGARVRAYASNGSVNGPVIQQTSSTWTESGITWSNKPAPTGAVLDDKGAVAKDAYFEYDVTPAITGNGTYSFVTLPTSTDAVEVNSRETSRPPILELRVDPPPDTSIDSGPPALTRSTTATFTFSSTEPTSTFACSLDGAAYATCSSPTDYTALADGTHTLSARATDSVGTTDPSPATYTWTVDSVAPVRPTLELEPASDTGTSNGDGITMDTTPTFTGTAEPMTHVSVTANGALLGATMPDETGRWRFASEELADGSYAIRATSEDEAGNESTTLGDIQLVVDTTPAAAPTLAEPAADRVTQSRDATVRGTATPGIDVEILDGTSTAATAVAAAAGDWSVQLIGLQDGSHPISAITRDAAGNASAPSPTRTVTVDNVAPETTIDVAPNDPTSRTTATFEFSATEAGSTFQCRLDGGSFASCTSPQSYVDLADGSHTFEVLAIDVAGNADATPAARTWTVNSSLPTRPVITAPADASQLRTPTVSVAGTAQPAVTVEVFDGGTSKGTTTASQAGDWIVDVGGLSDGAHTFTATTTNGGGSSGPSAPVTVTIDTVAPATSLDSGPPDASNSTSASFAFSSDTASATFECRIDSQAFAACASPHQVTGLSDGSHTFEVHATDAAGNTDPSPATATWTVDTVAPNTTILSGPSGTVAQATATFTFTATETGATFACRLDGGAFAACTSPHELSGLAAGSHTFEVRAADQAGNVDSSSATRTWRVEQTVFSDGFESGSFSAWSTVQTGADGTAVVQTDTVKSGTYAARLSATATTGSFALARYNLASAHADLTVDGDIRIEAEGVSGANVPVLRLFDGASARLISLYRQNLNSDRVYISHGGSSFVTTGRLPLNTWARFSLHVITAGTGASTIEVKLNGTEIYRTTTASLGTGGIASVQVGNETRKQIFRLVADDVSVTLR